MISERERGAQRQQQRDWITRNTDVLLARLQTMERCHQSWIELQMFVLGCTWCLAGGLYHEVIAICQRLLKDDGARVPGSCPQHLQYRLLIAQGAIGTGNFKVMANNLQKLQASRTILSQLDARKLDKFTLICALLSQDTLEVTSENVLLSVPCQALRLCRNGDCAAGWKLICALSAAPAHAQSC